MKSPIWISALLAVTPLASQVKITEAPGRIVIEVDGKPFTELYHSPDGPKPYLHPLRSASGKIVSRHFPMENVDGESKDHPHHRGLWFSHGEVNGFDFWSNEPGQSGAPKGRIVTKKIVALKGGKKSGSAHLLFDWVDPGGKLLIEENRLMTFYADPKMRTIDFDITLTAKEKVNFGDTKEGTFAIRLATPLEEQKKHAKMIDADGRETEKEVWGKKSNWVDYSGELEGEQLGITIMDHPGNPRHPTYWHSRAYGLFAANPFGEHEFLKEKEKHPGVDLAQGQTFRFRYRVIIHPGDTKSLDLPGMYQKYSAQK